MKNIRWFLPYFIKCALGLFAVATSLNASYAPPLAVHPVINQNSTEHYIQIPQAIDRERGNRLNFHSICYKSGPDVLEEIIFFHEKKAELSEMRTMLHICFGDEFANNYIKYRVAMNSATLEYTKMLRSPGHNGIGRKSLQEALQTVLHSITLLSKSEPRTLSNSKQYNVLLNLLRHVTCSTMSHSTFYSEVSEVMLHAAAYDKLVDSSFYEFLTDYRSNMYTLYRSLVKSRIMAQKLLGSIPESYKPKIPEWHEPVPGPSRIQTTSDGYVDLEFTTSYDKRDSATHTEFMVLYDILSRHKLPFDARKWNEEQKKIIFAELVHKKDLSNTMLSRKPMCPTCEAFLSSLYFVLSHSIGKNGDVAEIKDNNRRVFFIYSDDKQPSPDSQKTLNSDLSDKFANPIECSESQFTLPTLKGSHIIPLNNLIKRHKKLLEEFLNLSPKMVESTIPTNDSLEYEMTKYIQKCYELSHSSLENINSIYNYRLPLNKRVQLSMLSFKQFTDSCNQLKQEAKNIFNRMKVGSSSQLTVGNLENFQPIKAHLQNLEEFLDRCQTLLKKYWELLQRRQSYYLIKKRGMI